MGTLSVKIASCCMILLCKSHQKSASPGEPGLSSDLGQANRAGTKASRTTIPVSAVKVEAHYRFQRFLYLRWCRNLNTLDVSSTFSSGLRACCWLACSVCAGIPGLKPCCLWASIRLSVFGLCSHCTDRQGRRG